MNIVDTNIRAGDMRERIAIQANTPTQNSYGEMEAVWATITGGSVAAEARPLNGNEQMVAKQVNSSVSFVFILRHNADVTTKHRVSYRSRVFDINAVLNVDERRIKTVLLCSEAT